MVGNTAINTNADTEIQVTEATTFTGSIGCWGQGISDLTGIEAFTSLTQLDCRINNLTSLNITQNTALIYLFCYDNSITSLDVTQNTALTYLWCYENSLSSLDVTQNTALIQLQCYTNYSLSSLDVTQNTALTILWFSNCNLSSLDVTQNTALTYLNCASNNLSSLNVANGNNSNFGTFDATNNNLTCIQVDDAAYSTTNWTNIDAGASFSTNCSVGIDEQANSINLSIYPNPVTNQFTIELEEQIESIAIIDVMGKTVKTIVPTSNLIDVSDLTKGIYLLQIQTNKGLVSKKFVKE